MKPLTLAERSALANRISLGRVSRDELKAMSLTLSDAALLEGLLPRVQSPSGGQSQPELERLAASLRPRLQGSALLDPINFLLRAEESRLRPLLDESDYQYIMRIRRSHTQEDQS